ncbi:unnamed protein product [Linum tenue]|uniref:UVR domain-containing protein n=1 Tax=Linum tenue TaxID=586396 RepID=A0AAV0QZC4_9ROSI|nr:unnamed protein product [Linum tenue]
MAGANLWLAGGQAVATAPQLKPFCCLDSSSRKPINRSFGFVGLNTFLHHSSSMSRVRKNFTNLRSCHCGDDIINAESSTFADVCSSYSSQDWDWNRWGRHFAEIEQAESFASVLKIQLEEAIEKEDFQEAAKLKKIIAEATSMDSVGEIMSELENAIDEERYHDASKLCKHTGSGLVVKVVDCCRELVNASSGTLLFDIFVVKDRDEKYVMQVVCLRTKTSSMSSTTSPPKSVKPSMAEVESVSDGDGERNGVKEEPSDEKGVNIEGDTEEGIKCVINFLKDKIPGMNVKVMNLDVNGEVAAEDVDSLKQLIKDEDEKTVSNEDS